MKEMTIEQAEKIIEAYETDLIEFNVAIGPIKRHIALLQKDYSQLTNKETTEDDFDTAQYLRDQIAEEEKDLAHLEKSRKDYVVKYVDIVNQAYRTTHELR